MTDKQLVAHDVLCWINAGRIVPYGGQFFDDDLFDKFLDERGDIQVQTITNKIEKCEVCAIGAAVICHIDRFNKVTSQEMNKAISNNLREITCFDSEELYWMEAWFECFSHRYTCEGLDKPWSSKWEDLISKERMVYIFQNVVKHGEFKPELMEY